jgi:hypothetical protein
MASKADKDTDFSSTLVEKINGRETMTGKKGGRKTVNR